MARQGSPMEPAGSTRKRKQNALLAIMNVTRFCFRQASAWGNPPAASCGAPHQAFFQSPLLSHRAQAPAPVPRGAAAVSAPLQVHGRAAASTCARSNARPNLSQADKPGSPFEDLGIRDINEGCGRTRVRQHVNPLRSEYAAPPPPPDWSSLFLDPRLPLVVDMGCGPGRFLLLLQRVWRQQGQPPHNFLGLEIRAPLVDRANRWARQLGVHADVAYVYTNATVSLPAGLLATYPGPVSHLLVQFPDPHFKRRHHKRRILQPPVVAAAARLLAPGARVLLQSDVLEVAEAMRDAFEAAGSGAFRLAPAHAPGRVFRRDPPPPAPPALLIGAPRKPPPRDAGGAGAGADAADAAGAAARAHTISRSSGGGDAAAEETFVSAWQQGGWLSHNPLGVPTERELYVSEAGASVYRVLLERTAQAAGGP